MVSDKGGKTVEAGEFVLVSALEEVTNKSVVAGLPGERVRGRTAIVVSVSEFTVSGRLGETVVAGTAELVSVLGLVAVEGVVSDSLWETLGVVLGTVGLVSSGWVTSETVVFDFPAETIRIGTAELVSVWVTPEAVVSGFSVELV